MHIGVRKIEIPRGEVTDFARRIEDCENADNNWAEIAAIVEALDSIPEKSRRHADVTIYSDSAKAIEELSRARTNQSKYAAILEKGDSLIDQFNNIDFVKVKGHGKISGNVVAHLLTTCAVKVCQVMNCDLHRRVIINYP